MKNKRQVIPFRRKREGKTNYKKRIAYLSSDLPRLVVRKSLKNIVAQIVAYEPKGDRIVASFNSRNLIKLGWTHARSNMPSAYLVGYAIAKKAIKVSIKNAILDLGLYDPVNGSKLYAVLKGATDAGLSIPHEKNVLPPEERIKGKHIAEHKKIDVEKQFNEVLAKLK
jgi:large subunit ribosomal protein L18